MTFQVGLTGGIASGKSTVSRLFADSGLSIVDYDLLAREVVEPGASGLTQIAERFGDDVISEDGTLDRPALAAVVFADSSALKDLEAITHPAVRERAVQRVSEAGAIVVHDNPLLIEMGSHTACDLVIVVDTPVEQQTLRMVADRGMTPDEARMRIDNQIPRDDRLAAADIVVDNSGTLAELEQRVAELVNEIERRAGQ